MLLGSRLSRGSGAFYWKSATRLTRRKRPPNQQRRRPTLRDMSMSPALRDDGFSCLPGPSGAVAVHAGAARRAAAVAVRAQGLHLAAPVGAVAGEARVGARAAVGRGAAGLAAGDRLAHPVDAVAGEARVQVRIA